MKAALILVAVAAIFACTEASVLRSNRTKAVSKVPNTEKVTLGEATYVGSDIEYNSCSPFDPRRYSTLKVCGMSTQLKVYLRGRCEGYHEYTELIGECATTTSCHEVAISDNHWLQAAQSYEVVDCK